MLVESGAKLPHRHALKFVRFFIATWLQLNFCQRPFGVAIRLISLYLRALRITRFAAMNHRTTFRLVHIINVIYIQRVTKRLEYGCDSSCCLCSPVLSVKHDRLVVPVTLHICTASWLIAIDKSWCRSYKVGITGITFAYLMVYMLSIGSDQSDPRNGWSSNQTQRSYRVFAKPRIPPTLLCCVAYVYLRAETCQIKLT